MDIFDYFSTISTYSTHSRLFSRMQKIDCATYTRLALKYLLKKHNLYQISAKYYLDHYPPYYGDYDTNIERFNSVMAKINDFQKNLERECIHDDDECGLIEMISGSCVDGEYSSYSCSDYCENAAEDINKDLRWIFRITAGIGNFDMKKVRKKQ